MILAPGKAGHPQHGLWRASDDKIVGAGGVLLNRPGSFPAGNGVQKENAGDCYRVQVPGQPAASTTPAETAAGLTWLNYGLLSGHNRRLYGVDIGANCWLYVAPDKSIWHAKLEIFTGSGRVTFKRFGVFGGAVVTQVVNFSTAGFDVGGLDRAIDDIWIDGSKVLVSYHSWVSNDVYNGPCRYFKGCVKLTLGGTPPAATVAATLEVSYTEADPSPTETATRQWLRVIWDDRVTPPVIASSAVVTTQPNPADKPEFHTMVALGVGMSGNTSIKESVVGAYFDNLGNVQRVKVKVSTAVSISTTDQPRADQEVIDFTGSGTSTTTLTFSVGSQSTSYQITSTLAGSGYVTSAGGSYTTTATHTYEGATGTYTAAGGGAAYPWHFPLAGDIPLVITGGGLFFGIGFIGGNHNFIGHDFRRYGPGLFGVTQWQYVVDSGVAPTQWKHRALISLDAVTARSVTNAGQFDAYASRHPVSGEVQYAPTPVCWV